MPIKPKRYGQNVAYANSKNTGNLLKASIARVLPDGRVSKGDLNGIGRFLINPSSWEESKAANWVATQIPGQSDPIMQWLSSGPRSVSFEALITKDTSESSRVYQSSPTIKEDTNKTFLGKVAAAFFKVVPEPVKQSANWFSSTPTAVQESGGVTTDYYSIASQLNFFRSLLYPVYDDIDSPKVLRNSPPLVVLYVGNTFSKTNPADSGLTSSDDVWVVTNVRIRVTKQLPNLSPMEASVEFQLVQYNIKSSDGEKFWLQPVTF